MNEKPYRSSTTYSHYPHRKPIKSPDILKKPGYMILNLLFSTILFIIPYIIWINPMDLSFSKWGYIFLLSLFSGFIGSWVARILTGFFEDKFKTAQQIFRSMIVAFVYSILVILGVIGNLFIKYGIPLFSWDILHFLTTKQFYEMFAWLLMLKLVVFLLGDFLADKIAFDH